jgi:DNA-binding CsgD family transcriptional regulator
LLVDEDSRLVYANRQGHRIIAQTELLLVQQDCLRIRRGSMFVKFDAYRRQIAHRDIQLLGQCKALGTRLVARLTSIDTRDQIHAAPARLLWMMQIALLDAPSQPPAELLTTILGLSPAEASLVLQLHSGASLRGAAIKLGRSWHTAKTQLRSAFAKTRTRSQATLLLVVDRVARIAV